MKQYILNEKQDGFIHTLQEALRIIKDEESALAEGEAVRVIVQGMQHLTEPVRITTEMLPGPGHPVFIVGADNNSGFSGGIKVRNFTYWGKNIWRAAIPEVEYTRHLYIDGRSAKRPSTPMRVSHQWDVLEANDYYFANLPGEETKTIEIRNGLYSESFEVTDWSGIMTTHKEIGEWKNIRDLEMVFEVGWVHRVVPIDYVKPVSEDCLFIKPIEPAFRSARTIEGVQIGGCPNYIENVFEYLSKDRKSVV